MLFPLLALTLALAVQQPSTETSATPPTQSASALLFASDARLQKKVTLSEPVITLNDALKQLSYQTGIPLKMRDRKLLGEQKICVYASALSAKQLLESLAALLRYRNITSEWRKDAIGDGYALSVGRPSTTKRASREESEEPAASLALPQIVPPDGAAEAVTSISVTVNDDPASSVSVDAAPIQLATPELEKLRKKMIDDWLTRYDTRTSDKDDKTIPQIEVGGNSAQTKGALPTNTITRLLSDIAQKENVPVIAFLPPSIAGNEESLADHPQDAVSGKTLAAVLNGLSAPPFQFRYKWHQGTLLLRDPLTTIQENH